MARKASISDGKKSTAAGGSAGDIEKRLASQGGVPMPPRPAKPALPPVHDDDDDDDEAEGLALDEDDDEEDLVVFTAREAAGALATIYAFVRPLLASYKKILTFVGIGIVIATLFNVIMPLSLKFLIDDALGEEDSTLSTA